MASGGPLGLPGFDPTFAEGSLPARPTAMPSGAAPTGMPPSLPVQQKPGGMGGNDITQALRIIIPAIAAIYSAKSGNGGFGGFMHGYMGGEAQAAESADRVARRNMEQQRLGLEKDRVNREIAAQARAQAANERRQAEALDAKAAVQKAAQEKSIHDILERTIRPMLKLPGFVDKINKQGADKYTVNVPGLGNINLKEGLDRIGAVQGPDGYQPEEAAKVKEPDLVPTPGLEGPTYQPKVAGGKVYERPRAPKEPKAAGANRAYTWKDDDPESDTFGKSFRVTEDANGNILKKVPLTGADMTAPSSAPTKATAPSITPGKKKIGRFLVEPG